MVAPTRAPQARGVKCDLCKKILASATWLDQTKLAKNIEEAQNVLDLICQHETSGCLCIPKNIENLLVGSTHFEIHRLSAKSLDVQVHKRQYEHFKEAKQRAAKETSKHQNENINDCNDANMQKNSRFKIYSSYNDQKHQNMSKQQLKHLSCAVEFWKLAMEDQANPFNSRLALRLGLTHHVIYACYLFKYHKILDYQLLAANLLLNLFKSIEGVTANAILHANYLLVKTLLDCNQIQLARQCLKQATKIINYQDKTHYESILLTCVSCELSLLDNDDTYSILDNLAQLAIIQPDDKLQHYYARTLALSMIIKYLHCYPSRSDVCYEFYHTFRYMCAIIRRCYEGSFELVLSEKDVKQQQTKQQQPETQQNQILDHSWIRFAVCDFVFSTFDLLSSFYTRTGQPESLELLYNGINLIAFRNGSCYWQTRMAIIGASLDILCDKLDHAKAKLDTVPSIMSHVNDPHLAKLLRLDLEVSELSILDRQETVINKEVMDLLLQRLKTCQNSLLSALSQIELYDCKSNNYSRLVSNTGMEIVLGDSLGHLSLKALKIAILSMLRASDLDGAKNLITNLVTQLNATDCKLLEYNDSQTVLETLLYFADIDKSDQLLLDAIGLSQLFLETENNLVTIESQLSMLTINGDSNSNVAKKRPTKNKPKFSRLSLGRRSRRKGTYDVASRSEENLSDRQVVRFFDPIETLKNFSILSKEEIVVSYLRNSEPNPDYLMYRRAHELMFCFRLMDGHQNHDQLLYHFCESSASNTMRYRWMMFDEQQASPFDPPKTPKCTSTTVKYLGFNNILVNSEKTLKTLIKAVPEDCKLAQFKYILDRKCKNEHLLIVCFDSDNDPIYVHAKKSVSSEDFLMDAKLTKNDSDFEAFTLPNKFMTKIDEAKKTLFFNNQRSRIEKRQNLEKEIGEILRDLENDWLGPFRFLLCGKTCDANYKNFIHGTVNEMQSIMGDRQCNSLVALRSVIENAPSLNNEEFRQLISSLFSCSSGCDETRDCFNKWLKSMESFVAEQTPGLNKITYLQTLKRGQLGLILDKDLELIAFESLPIVRIMKQGIFRVPSLRLFNIIVSRSNCNTVRVDSDEIAYILDPASNLAKTRERFENKLKSQNTWTGTISQPPKTDHLENWFTTKEVYIFIGHGAGTAYYNKLCKGRGLSAMPLIKPMAIVMGCSSSRVLAEGPRLESFGISWVFIFRGSPSYLGLLWDVTDTDIDRFLDSLLTKWMGSKWQQLQATSNEDKMATDKPMIPTTEAAAQARHVCQFKFLVGSTPVIYGLPVWCKPPGAKCLNK